MQPRFGKFLRERQYLTNVSPGFQPPVRTLHAFRHTFAVNNPRGGGSVFSFVESTLPLYVEDDAATFQLADRGLAGPSSAS